MNIRILSLSLLLVVSGGVIAMDNQKLTTAQIIYKLDQGNMQELSSTLQDKIKGMSAARYITRKAIDQKQNPAFDQNTFNDLNSFLKPYGLVDDSGNIPQQIIEDMKKITIITNLPDGRKGFRYKWNLTHKYQP